MSQGRVKLYKNSERNVDTAHQPYVPQYQLMGLDPEEYKSSSIPSDTSIAKGSEINPRDKKPPVRPLLQDSVKNNSIPNVGHNRDFTWSGVDDQLVDDLEDVEIMSPMIDNNDYVSDDALGVSSNSSKNETHKKVDYASDFSSIKENEYVLIINETIICSGELSVVESQVRDLVFGDHELCDGHPIPVQELIVMKRVPIKIGVFLE